jgi:hypothetical protein
MLDVQDLLPGSNEGTFEAIDFIGDFSFRELAPMDHRPRPIEEENLATANAGGDWDTPEDPLALSARLWHGEFLTYSEPIYKAKVGRQAALAERAAQHRR